MSTNSRFAVAVHVMSLMAWSGEEPLKSDQVADSVNTNPVVIRRMLLELAEAGLVGFADGFFGRFSVWQLTQPKPLTRRLSGAGVWWSLFVTQTAASREMSCGSEY
jgi:hypothetical protein